MKTKDPYNLQRFLDAQVEWIERVYRELQDGCKVNHWMWFIFPQLKGLGHSARANHYGIASLDEARQYLAHPILGSRLRHCTSLVLKIEERSIDQIFPEPDDLKFRSSMTLFAEANPMDQIFRQSLEKYFGGRPDLVTIRRLKGER